MDLVGRQDLEVAGAPDGDALGVLGGVGVDPALALGALEDRVELDEDLLDRAAGELALGEQALAVGVDAACVDRPQQGGRAELRQEVAAHGVAVVAHGRRAQRLLVLDVVKPRVAGLRERTVLVALVPRVSRLA